MTTGSGTSGTIARRLAHLLATCGMHAFFVHPADALHGPSAAVAPGDVLIALSKAGKSAEINDFARVARARGGKVISLTWKPDSELGALSDVVLVLPNAWPPRARACCLSAARWPPARCATRFAWPPRTCAASTWRP